MEALELLETSAPMVEAEGAEAEALVAPLARIVTSTALGLSAVAHVTRTAVEAALVEGQAAAEVALVLLAVVPEAPLVFSFSIRMQRFGTALSVPLEAEPEVQGAAAALVAPEVAEAMVETWETTVVQEETVETEVLVEAVATRVAVPVEPVTASIKVGIRLPPLS